MMRIKLQWAGKVAVVTGASSGIGASVAVALAENGMIVVGIARRDYVIRELAGLTNGTIHAMKCDLTKDKDVIETFKKIENTYGGIDVLVNSAGIIQIGGLIDCDPMDMRRLMDVNVLSTTLCSKEAIKSMRKRGDCGQVIFINSVSGHIVPQYENMQFGLYYPSKHAITALSETLRVELLALKSNIKVTSISPGSVYTQMTKKIIAQVIGKPYDPSDPLGSPPPLFLDVQDVTDAIIYVLNARPHVQIKELTIQPVGMKFC